MDSPFKSIKAAAAAVILALVAGVDGHMIMAQPTPFNAANLDNSPLSSSGSNYPCKIQGDPATFYKRDGISNSAAIGEKKTISFKGSAVHGGGSCQLAITSDLQPTAKSTWQVILSIEGGCPSTDGSGPSTYEWSIPQGVESGDYVFAWTWVSKLAGQPELYMNCAPLTVTGGSSKRSMNETIGSVDLLPRDTSLPDLCVVNIASVNLIKTTPGTDPQYPNPGKVSRPGKSNNFAKITGSCAPGGGSTGGSSGSDSAGSDSGSTGSTSGTSESGNSGSSGSSKGSSGSDGPGSDPGSTSESSGSGSSSPPVDAASGSSAVITASIVSTSGSSDAGVPALTESVYVSIPDSQDGGASSATDSVTFGTIILPSASASGSTPGDFATMVIPSPSASFSASYSNPVPAASASASVPAGGSGSGSGSGSSSGTTPLSGGGLSGPCTEEGTFNCVGGTQYQQCGSGSWSVLMSMPAGTKCKEGKTTTLWGRSERPARYWHSR